MGCATRSVFGLLTGIAALVLGVVHRPQRAWFGGVVDQIPMRLADILLAIPAVMILILVAAFFRPSPVTLALILACSVLADHGQGHPRPGPGGEVRRSHPGRKADGSIRCLHHCTAPAAGAFPALPHRFCHQGPHGHVHGGVSLAFWGCSIRAASPWA